MIEIEILLTFVYFLECTVVQCKDALSIYWNRHGHECSRIWKLSANFTLIQCIKIVSSLMGRDISGKTFFRAEIYRGRLLTLIIGSSSRLHRIQFSADLTMYWFPVCYFRCVKFKPLVIWKILLFLPYLELRPILDFFFISFNKKDEKTHIMTSQNKLNQQHA
jgi:hypothetical protein